MLYYIYVDRDLYVRCVNCLNSAHLPLFLQWPFFQCCALFASDRDRSEPNGGDVVGVEAVRGGVFSGLVLGAGPRASRRSYVTGM